MLKQSKRTTLLRHGPDCVRVLALTILGEADDQGWEGWVAVANAVLNRVREGRWHSRGPKFGKRYGYEAPPGSVAAVCLHPWQFSCWNGSAGEFLAQRPVHPMHVHVAELAVRDLLKDVTGGATHYYAPQRVQAPDWATDGRLTAEIGGHRFYAGVA